MSELIVDQAGEDPEDKPRIPDGLDKKTRKSFPVLFCLEGGIRMYDGTMRDLYSKVKIVEWEMIVDDTVRMYNFILALKEVGMPRLAEKWTMLHEYFLKGLGVNIERMRRIEPVLLAKIDQEKLQAAYRAKMETNSAEVNKEISQIRAQMEDQKSFAEVDLKIVSDI